METLLLVLGGLALFATGLYIGFRVGAWSMAVTVLRALDEAEL